MVLSDSFLRISRFLVYTLVGVVFFLWQPSHINPYDEGIILTGAMRVLASEIPSADFYVNYGPAQFYLVATAMEIFGRNADTGRVIHSLALTLSLFFSHKLLLLAGMREQALYPLSVIFVLMLYFGTQTPLYPAIACIPLILLGCILTIGSMKSPGGFRSFIPIAILISTIAVFRYDMGLMAMVAFAIPLFLINPSARDSAWLGGRFNFALLLQYGLVVSGVMMFVLACLYLAGILETTLRDLVTYTGTNYAEMRSLPFPDLNDFSQTPLDVFAVYLPILCMGVGAIICVSFYPKNRRTLDTSYISIVLLTGVTLGCLFKGLVRTSPIHMLMANVPGVILIALCIHYLFKDLDFRLPGLSRKGAFFVPAAFSVVLIVAALQDTSQGRSVLYGNLDLSSSSSNLPTLRSLTADSATRMAAERLAQLSQPDERVLVATGRHDKVFANNVSLYFLAQRLPGTRWHQYDPGIQTTEKIQREMIRDLESFDVKWVVVDSRWDNVREPNKSAESSGIFLLDEYLQRNYRPVDRFGTIEIRQRWN